MADLDRQIPRRDFLKGTAAAAAGLALGGCASAQSGAGSTAANRSAAIAAPARADKKPNILWIMSDEHNPRVLGCYGNKVARTPHLDSIAERGVTFDAMYCNSPLCVPSRSSLTAGKYCSRVGVWGNNSELPSADIPSLPRVLNAAGYESFLCGKQHYDYSRRYGFTEVGGNFNWNYKEGKGGRRKPDDLTQNKLSSRFEEFHPGNNGGPVVHDRKVTAGAVEFLSKRPAGEKPFFLYTGFLCPHFPLVVPEPYASHFNGKVAMPEIPQGHLDQLPLNYKHLRAGFKMMGVPDDTVRRGRELYYGLTEWIDNEIGKVLTALRANPAIAENTVIIYTSDHGENMGEHGLWWKNNMFDHAARIPAIISYPERFKGDQRRTQACSLLDVVQTVADLGGGQTPGDWNGSSMARWMDNPSNEWKDFAVSEYYAHHIASGFVMARAGDWKYTYHTVIDDKHPAQRQLFNLAADPGEFNNLADKPEHAGRIKELHARLTKEVGQDPDETEQRARRELAKGYDRKDPPPAGKKKGAEE